MAIIDLGEGASNTLPFLVERARAIDSYARVEHSLSSLFADLLGTHRDIGGIVFFKITNASARNAMIESLLEKKHGATYEAFWSGIPNTPNKRGLFTLVRQLDQTRNEIIHWTTVNSVSGDPPTRLIQHPEASLNHLGRHLDLRDARFIFSIGLRDGQWLS